MNDGSDRSAPGGPGVSTRTESRLLSTSLTLGEDTAPHVVGARGVWFELEDGRRVIDASNTAAPLGHAHPEIADAIRRAADAPVLNEGVGWLDRERAADDLVRIAFEDEDWVGAVRFFISASEANDVALALCQALTGRAALATRERAYHGGAGLARELTVQPHWHGGLSSAGKVKAPPRLALVHEIGAPSAARVTGQTDNTPSAAWLADAEAKLADSAAVILDYSQGGIYHSPEYQDRVAAVAREAETIMIADETVTGFGRVGGWFQFQHANSRPDIVTMGKGLAAGGAPAGAVVFSKRITELLAGTSWQTYSTFRGHPIEVAAIRAHLKVSARDQLVDRAYDLDPLMLARFGELAASHPSVSRIDGRGLHWTVELHGPSWRQWRADDPEPVASRVVTRALEAGALFATSGEQTSIFIAPPIIISEDELEKLFAALDHGLSAADEEIDAG
ncbi:MAG: aminotransferase class III-fold pyridoxal phosphate-dependent enzyme [Solirubrobacterales bacterium]